MKELVNDLKMANDNLYCANKMLEEDNKRLKEVINGMIDNEEKYNLEIIKLKSIIKEVREYIEKNTKEGLIKDKRYFYSPEQANDILGILDKENKND